MDECDDPSKRFAKALNEHGYPFHNAVMRHVADLNSQGRTPWMPEAAEFPVRIGGKDTRIDFILGLPLPQKLYMIAECKRVNPAYSDWLFAKSSFVSRKHKEMMLVDAVEMHQDIRVATVRLRNFEPSEVFHIAISVKSGNPGDTKGNNTNVIDESATQVLRGVNGLIDCLKGKEYGVIRNRSPVFIPVIFTTAKLWFTDADLSTAELRSGIIDNAIVSCREIPYLYFQYHTSVSTKHDLRQPPGVSIPESLAIALRHSFIRTIAVVNVGSIEAFLRSAHPDTFDPERLDPISS